MARREGGANLAERCGRGVPRNGLASRDEEGAVRRTVQRVAAVQVAVRGSGPAAVALTPGAAINTNFWRNVTLRIGSGIIGRRGAPSTFCRVCALESEEIVFGLRVKVGEDDRHRVWQRVAEDGFYDAALMVVIAVRSVGLIAAFTPPVAEHIARTVSGVG